jgi:ribosomal protein S18 acetylase RimI-like enzyme
LTAAATVRPSFRSGLRPVDPRRDLAGLADLIELAFVDSLDPAGRRMAQEMRRYGRLGWVGWLFGHLMLPPAAYPQGYVWVEGGRLVGNASLMPVEGTVGRWVLANVAVDPHYRRRGIARSLVGACLDLGERRWAREIILQVKARNEGAKDLYRGFGFAEQGTRVSWRKTRPAAGAGGELPARPRRDEDWPQQWSLAQRVVPLGLVWPHPLRPSLFRPSPWYSADQWAHWIWPAEGAVRAGLSARDDPDGGTQMFMVCEPEAVGRAEASLLALALAAALERGGQVRLESEAGDGEQIVRSFGFREDHRLAWMRLEK